MKKYHVLHNPLAGHGKVKKEKEILNTLYGSENLVYSDMTELVDYQAFFDGIPKGEDVIICGGDGTLNHFVNRTKGLAINCNVYYLGSGSGNDFLRDMEGDSEKTVLLNDCLKNLPTVTIKGTEYLFLNGVGFGIDGYCCEKGDELRSKTEKNINYTNIAIQGLLFDYKPTDAIVLVDGKEYAFKKVWLAPTMLGRFYGGGMMPAPNQTRNSDELSIMIFHGGGKVESLLIFPSIFKGEHLKHDKYVTVLSGKEITVKFNKPRAAQIDGETILNVMEYTARR